MAEDPDPQTGAPGEGGADSAQNPEAASAPAPPDPAVLEAAHQRTATLRVADFDGLVGESFTLHYSLDGYDAGGVPAVLTLAEETRGEPLDENSRQPFRLQFDLDIANNFGQRTFLLRHEKTGDFWAMMVPSIQTATVFTMVANFN